MNCKEFGFLRGKRRGAELETQAVLRTKAVQKRAAAAKRRSTRDSRAFQGEH